MDDGLLLVEILFIVICAHWKQKQIITTFKLIIFYCLTTSCNIKFFKYFSLNGLFYVFFKSLCKVFYLKRFNSFLNKKKCSLPPGFWLSRKMYWYIMLKAGGRGLHGRIFMKINIILKHISSILLCLLKENFQKPTSLIFCFFCFFCFHILQINLN